VAAVGVGEAATVGVGEVAMVGVGEAVTVGVGVFRAGSSEPSQAAARRRAETSRETRRARV
jgi:hypothetical protein